MIKKSMPYGLILLFFSLSCFAAAESTAFSPERLTFSVKIHQDIISDYTVLGVFVLPGEKIPLSIEDSKSEYSITSPQGALKKQKDTAWAWTAPKQPGLYTLIITNKSSHETMQLNAFVMHPKSKVKNGMLNGYRIGHYPNPPADKNKKALYAAPQGFIEVTRDNMEALVAPHFKLGQFVCKQGSGCTKYIALKEQLLINLEHLLEKTNQAGIAMATFNIMSAYRTPHYNTTIGNTKHSRHQFGDAVDILVGDVNKDGKTNVRDAEKFYSLVEEKKNFDGGIGLYQSNHAHGPFVHVDVRGFEARWGHGGKKTSMVATRGGARCTFSSTVNGSQVACKRS